MCSPGVQRSWQVGGAIEAETQGPGSRGLRSGVRAKEGQGWGGWM